jgi:hypothetical protein
MYGFHAGLSKQRRQGAASVMSRSSLSFWLAFRLPQLLGLLALYIFLFSHELSTNDFVLCKRFPALASVVAKFCTTVRVLAVEVSEKYSGWTTTGGRMADWSRLPLEATRQGIASFDLFVFARPL